MAKIGIDFGTTNSSCCAYDKEKGIYHFLHFGVEARDYFPTVIAYENGSPVYIGTAAKECRFCEEYDVYELFKLALGQGAGEKHGRDKSPLEAARDFLQEVVRAYEEAVQEEVESIVMTVPDIWKNEQKNKIALDNLTEIFQQLGYEAEVQAVFESEPVSAAAYYCTEICKGQYEGYIAVVDYGGGTLDVTLCKAEGGKIYVLHRCGNGGTGETGCAGAAFDEAATQRLVSSLGLDPEAFGKESMDFKELQGLFEHAKIASTKLTREALSDYYVSGGADDRKAFSVNARRLVRKECTVMAGDIAQTFEAVNQKALDDALQAILRYCEEEHADIQSQQSFRVLMVGGFSNLYCVESAVRRAFRSIDGIKDLRFDNGMKLEERSTAIAQGAALIASDMVSIVPMCHSEVGFYCCDCYARDESGDIAGKMRAFPIIQRGMPVSDYREPCFFPAEVHVNRLGMDASVTIYFDDGYGKVPVKMDKTVAELFPNLNDVDNAYQLGFSMTRSGRPMFHVRDRNGEVRTDSLQRILENIPLMLVPEGGMEYES